MYVFNNDVIHGSNSVSVLSVESISMLNNDRTEFDVHAFYEIFSLLIVCRNHVIARRRHYGNTR